MMPATDLVYMTPQIETFEGTTAQSIAPTMKGTGPFTFSVTTEPSSTGITIDNQGIISVSDKVAPKSYKVNVTIKNSVASQPFDNAFTVLINSKGKVTFSKDIKPITQLNCSSAGCHPNYLNQSEVAVGIDKILDRVQRKPTVSGFMPRQSTPLTEEQIKLLKTWVSDGFRER